MNVSLRDEIQADTELIQAVSVKCDGNCHENGQIPCVRWVEPEATQ